MSHRFFHIYQMCLNQPIFLSKEENLYFQFLETKFFEFAELCKTVPSDDLQKKYEIHHIIPYHAGGTDEIENLIPLTPCDHALAHYYRYFVMKDLKDLWVWNLRKNSENSSFQTKAGRLALARQLFREHSKKEKKYFWDSVWQSEQAKKGARKGGLQNTPKQREARKRIGTILGKEYGKLNGRKQGLQNQKDTTKQALRFSYCWVHPFYGTIQTTPEHALIDLAEQCLSFASFRNSLPENSEKRRVSRQLGRVIRKERKSYYGWAIQQERVSTNQFDEL